MYAEALEQQLSLLRFLEERGQDRDWWAPLERAETFYVGRVVEPLLAAGAAATPRLTLSADVLPASDAFVWFEQPLWVETGLHLDARFRTATRGTEARAVAWTGALIRPRDGGAPRPGITTMLVCGDRRRPAGLPFLRSTWAFGVDTWAAKDRARRGTQAKADELLEDYDPDGLLGDFVLDRLSALFAFCAQRLLTTRPEPVDRAARRRLARAGWTPEPVVRVVTLRRIERSATRADEPMPVNWASRWLVRGHLRQQWFPASNEHRPIWIMPHVKGPEDKPLKPPRATVFAVVR